MPEVIANILREPPANADPVAQLQAFQQQYDVPPDLLMELVGRYEGAAQEYVRSLLPAQPDPQPLRAEPVQEQAPEQTPEPAYKHAEALDAGPWPAPAKCRKGVGKADRLKLACAALSGGRYTLAEAERYFVGDAE